MNISEETRTQRTITSALAAFSNAKNDQYDNHDTWEQEKDNDVCNLTNNHLNALHVITVKDISKLYVMPNDVDMVDLEAFYRFSVHDLSRMAWNVFLECDEFHDYAKRAAIYDMLSRYATQAKKPLSADPSSTSVICKFDRLYFTKALCEYFIQENNKQKCGNGKGEIIWLTSRGSFDVKIDGESAIHIQPDGIIAVEDAEGVKHPYVWIDVQSSASYNNNSPGKAILCLALALDRYRSFVGYEDYKVFGIDLCGRYASFWSAYFDGDYLKTLEDPVITILTRDQYALVRRSKIFDLIECEGRMQFARHFMGMLNEINDNQD